ncbi:MAG TPA: RHS repeat-associated core domain-containing protein, partial [Mycobacteriales bacterium]|nr:RHS repeat-associated core domain-containing protein [Mycobacteriales bacterium]
QHPAPPRGHRRSDPATSRTSPLRCAKPARRDRLTHETKPPESPGRFSGPLAQFSQATNAFGEIRTQASPESSQTLSYDADARLAQVADIADGTCQTRAYTVDADTNRTGLSSYPADGSGACSTTTTPTTASWTHDAADRTTNTGYSYDPMGRTLTVPGTDTSSPGSAGLTLTYYANDMVHSQHIGATTTSYALDPAGREFSALNSNTGNTTTAIYSDGSDSPARFSVSTGAWTRNVTDIAGNLAAVQSRVTAGYAALQIVNPHGDVVATLSDPSTGAATMSHYFESTEFGVPRASNTAKPAHYGWLGGKRRDSGDLGGLVLMGIRMYDPYSGRFLSVDPVPGGSANDYDYSFQDPVNGFDLNGRCSICHRVLHAISKVAHASGRAVGAALHHASITIKHDVIDAANRDVVQKVGHFLVHNAKDIGITALAVAGAAACVGVSGSPACVAVGIGIAAVLYNSTHTNASNAERDREAGKAGLHEVLAKLIESLWDD